MRRRNVDTNEVIRELRWHTWTICAALIAVASVLSVVFQNLLSGQERTRPARAQPAHSDVRQ